jgi:hypothetical protein
MGEEETAEVVGAVIPWRGWRRGRGERIVQLKDGRVRRMRIARRKLERPLTQKLFNECQLILNYWWRTFVEDLRRSYVLIQLNLDITVTL